jgi:hypothetical protein
LDFNVAEVQQYNQKNVKNEQKNNYIVADVPRYNQKKMNLHY